MNKKNNLALYTLFFAGLFSLFTSNIFAQKTELSKPEQLKQCSSEKFVMPSSIAVDNNAFADFIKVMSLPSGKRQKMFSDISNEEKASVFKVQIALNFIKRPNLTKEQKDLLLDAISNISADTYNRENPELIERNQKQAEVFQQKALAIFPPAEAYEIFANLNGDKTDEINFLKKYDELLSLPINVRKKIIRESSPLERSNFWKSQMIYHIATAKFNKSQLNFVVDLIPFLTVRAFDLPKITDQSKNEDTTLLDSFEQKASNIFSKEEVFTIFMSFGIQKEIPPDNKSSGDLRETCDCNYWCGVSSFCGDGGGCNPANYGCGWTGNSPCTLRC